MDQVQSGDDDDVDDDDDDDAHNDNGDDDFDDAYHDNDEDDEKKRTSCQNFVPIWLPHCPAWQRKSRFFCDFDDDYGSDILMTMIFILMTMMIMIVKILVMTIHTF